MKKVIDKNKILINAAGYSANDLAIDEGTLTLAGTDLAIRWDSLKNHKVTSYTAGSYSRRVFDFGSITPVDEAAHVLTLVTSKSNTTQPEATRTAWGDSSATAEEISDIIGNEFQNQNPGSKFKCTFDDANDTLTVDLEEDGYPELFFRTNIAGLTNTYTPAVKPVGGEDAANLSGYDPTKDYDRYELFEEGTFLEDGRDIPCLFRYVIFVDDTTSAFATDWDEVVEQTGVSAVADHVKYTEKPSA